MESKYLMTDMTVMTKTSKYATTTFTTRNTMNTTNHTLGSRLKAKLAMLGKIDRPAMQKGRRRTGADLNQPSPLTTGPRTATDDMLAGILPTSADLARARQQRADLAGGPVPRVAPAARVPNSTQAPRIAAAYERDARQLDDAPLAYAGNVRPLVPRDPFADEIEARRARHEHVLALIRDALARKPHTDPRIALKP